MDKLAVVTGGSSGLGLAMAEVLGRKGYKLVLIARNRDRLTGAAKYLADHGIEAHTISADVTSADDLARAREEIKSLAGRIDFLVLNAGIVSVKLLSEYETADELVRDVQVDLLGVMKSAYFFEPLLARGSSVLITSSAMGLFGLPGYTAYSAAKAGVLNFGQAWRRELIARGINLFVAVPADVDTPMLKAELESQPDWMKEKAGPRKAQPADKIARRIINKCKGKYRFLIAPSADVKFLVFVLKVLPIAWSNWLIDKLFPMPGR